MNNEKIEILERKMEKKKNSIVSYIVLLLLLLLFVVMIFVDFKKVSSRENERKIKCDNLNGYYIENLDVNNNGYCLNNDLLINID